MSIDGAPDLYAGATNPLDPASSPLIVVLPDHTDDLGEGKVAFYEQAVELAARIGLAHGLTRSAAFLRLNGDLLVCVAACDEPGSSGMRGPFQLAERPEFRGAVDTGEVVVDGLVAIAPVRAHGAVAGVLAVDVRNREFGAPETEHLVGLARLLGYRIARDAAFAELEREAELSRRLERLKSEFLNIAAHELRSPLGVIRGYASMLSEGGLESLVFEAALARIEEKSEEMARLITEMLDTARLEAMSLSLDLGPVELVAVVEDAIAATRPLLGDSHRCTLEPGIGSITVVADRNRLTTVLTNLLGNAVKYSPKGGDIQVRLEHDSREVHIVVQDHGIGISADQIPMLFSTFGRLVTPETNHIRGTGLGLYLAREMARLHGGDITVELKLGAGSTFTVTLPLS